MAGVRITDLGALSVPDGADKLYIVDVSDTSESPQGTSKQTTVAEVLALVPGSSGVQSVTGELVDNADIFNPIVRRPYLTWVGLLDQAGSADPTGIELENTLGVSITFTRDSAGEFSIRSSSGIFNSNNTLVLATAGGSTYNDCFVVIISVRADRINFYNYGNGGGYQDNFSRMNFEIRVY